MRVADIHEEKHRRRRKQRFLGWSRMRHCQPPVEMVYLMNRWMTYYPSHPIWKQSKIFYTDEEADFHAKRICIRKQYPIHRITESEEPPESDDTVDEGHEGGVIIENQARKGRDLSMEVEETVERTPLCECLPFSSPIEHDSPSSASEEAWPHAVMGGLYLEPPSLASSSSASAEPLVRNMARLAIRYGDDDVPSPHTLITRLDTHSTLRYHCAIHDSPAHTPTSRGTIVGTFCRPTAVMHVTTPRGHPVLSPCLRCARDDWQDTGRSEVSVRPPGGHQTRSFQRSCHV